MTLSVSNRRFRMSNLRSRGKHRKIELSSQLNVGSHRCHRCLEAVGGKAKLVETAVSFSDDAPNKYLKDVCIILYYRQNFSLLEIESFCR